MKTNQNYSRRDFLKTTGAAVTAGFALSQANGIFPAPAFGKTINPNEKLNIAFVGVAGMQGDYHLGEAGGENLIGICDVDSRFLDRTGERFPDAKRFNDFRVMYDELGDKLDAVLITTPDHIHAHAGIGAMKRGLHCYCEKPLAHTVDEIRKMTKLAKEKKLVTQMGTQIHAGDNYRRVVELVKGGAIGPVKEVHVWCGTAWGNRSMPTEFQPVPEYLSWDLWLGPVPHREYSPVYFGGNWRCFWTFGNGSLGDMGSHHIDLPFWALDL
ncbi:MAG: Gfo/Idh/MocA family oxidoreductase, partial [Thermoguttaceae bacterium]